VRAYAVDLTEVISTLIKDSWIILPVLLPWVVIFIAARRFEKRRRDQGAWNESGPIDPTYAPAHNNLAIAYEHEGDLAKARAAYERALELEPGNALIKQNYELFREINDRTTGKNTQ